MKRMVCGLFITSTVLGLAGCATDDPHRRAKTGAALGAVAGAVLGHQIDGKKGRFVGAAAGALAGAAVGDYMDDQQKEFEEQLAAEREAKQLEIERMENDLLKLSLSSEVSFDFDSAKLKPSFEPSLKKLTKVLKKYDKTLITVVGHTDSVGSEAYNQKLSERRAAAVKTYLIDHGIEPARITAIGRGESEPRDTNETEAGRQLNRRVEILVKPITAESSPAAG